MITTWWWHIYYPGKESELIDDDYVIVSIHSYAPYNFARDYTTETTFDNLIKDTVPLTPLDVAY